MSSLVCIRSRDLQNTNSFLNFGSINLNEAIEAEDDEVLQISLKSGTFPNSFHNLSAINKNNTITFQESGQTGTSTITFTNGSYNIQELMDEMKALLEEASHNNWTYTLAYSEITNKITITKDSYTAGQTVTFDFTTETSARRFFGFRSGTFVIDSASGIMSDRGVDISDTQNAIYVRLCNLASNKVIESSSKRYSNIIAVVPLPLSRNAFFVYEPNSPFVCELMNRSISRIELLITFQNQADDIDFRGCDYELNFEISRKKVKQEHLPDLSMTKDIEERVKQHQQKLEQTKKSQKQLDDTVKKIKSQINI